VQAGTSSLGLKAYVIFGVFAICTLTPAVAGARSTVPPGSTEGDQYFEQVPNGGGSSSLDRHSGGSGGSGAVPATQALNALGPEGQAAADLANSNRPPQEKAGRPRQGEAAQRSNEPPASSTEGEEGMEALFPILLGLTALAAISYGAWRRLTTA
jgi:hypothetical protein